MNPEVHGGSDGESLNAVVRLKGVALTYPGPPPVSALRPLDLSIRQGEYVAVVGPSGSGKSTLLNVLGLLDRPTEGSYELDGVDVQGLPEADRTALRARRIGFVFQAFHLLAHRTAIENVALALLYSGTRRRERESLAGQALDRVGLSHRAHALPTTLSGGERQRVAIARALVTNPALLLCDEPTGNLDSATGAAVLDLIGRLNGDGVTVVLITHDAAAAGRATRELHMRDGHLGETDGQASDGGAGSEGPAGSGGRVGFEGPARSGGRVGFEGPARSGGWAGFEGPARSGGRVGFEGPATPDGAIGPGGYDGLAGSHRWAGSDGWAAAYG